MAKLSNLEYFAFYMDIDNKADFWRKILVKCFKKQPNIIFIRLTNKKYILKDAYN